MGISLNTKKIKNHSATLTKQDFSASQFMPSASGTIQKYRARNLKATLVTTTRDDPY